MGVKVCTQRKIKIAVVIDGYKCTDKDDLFKRHFKFENSE